MKTVENHSAPSADEKLKQGHELNVTYFENDVNVTERDLLRIRERNRPTSLNNWPVI